MHALSTYGTWILGVGFLIMAAYLTMSLINGKKATKNPWVGLTLEWTTSSPPPTENFLGNPRQLWGPYDYDRVLMDENGLVTFNPNAPKDDHHANGENGNGKAHKHDGKTTTMKQTV